jgi:hypothetical protein
MGKGSVRSIGVGLDKLLIEIGGDGQEFIFWSGD